MKILKSVKSHYLSHKTIEITFIILIVFILLKFCVGILIILSACILVTVHVFSKYYCNSFSYIFA